MSDISAWSATAASNNFATPDGWPEGQAPSTVNDCAREMMASIRRKWQDAEWFNWGHAPTRTSTTTFTVSTNVKSIYAAGRRLRCNDATTLYGQVTDSTYTSNTNVTVALDSGSLSASLSSVAVSNIMPTSNSLPNTIGRKGADIASASSIDLGAATGDFVDVTGTTTITSLGTVAAGIVKTVRFTGALTLTHNGTSLILPGAVNITTTSGDTAIFRSLGSGNWVCISYKLASGTNTIIGIKGADIASASTVDLSTATGDFVDVTGTTTITALGTLAAGIERTVRFTGALTLTHNSTSLILPSSANITTANGDTAIFRSLGSGNWKCVSYTKQDGTAVVSTVASAGALIWLQTNTASSSSISEFNGLISSTYSSYLFIFENILPATNNVSLYCQLGTGGTPTYTTSGYEWSGQSWNELTTNSATGASSAAQIPINSSTYTLNNTIPLSGHAYLHGPNGSSAVAMITSAVTYMNNDGTTWTAVDVGGYQAAATWTAIKFYMSSGNIASGKIHMYGVKHA